MLGLNNGIYLGFKENETALSKQSRLGVTRRTSGLVDLVYVK
jgi:hypothetical protein